MPFVLDASVALSWAFPDEPNSVALRARQLLQTQGEYALVPVLWWYEMRNALLMGERRGRTTPDRTAVFLDELGNLAVQIVSGGESASLIDLARAHQLTVYDAACLSLAIRERLPLATLDRRLSEAAAALKVPVLS